MKRTKRSVLAAIVFALLVPVATANASPAKAGIHSRTHDGLVFTAPTDRPIHVTFFRNDEGVVTVRDGLGRITPHGGCDAVSAREIECDHPAAITVHLEGSPFEDLIRFRYAVQDSITDGAGGDDRLYGQAGNDGLFGGTGHDVLHGWGGDDRLAGNVGDDRLFGGSGNDALETSAFPIEKHDGTDEIFGGGGIDSVSYAFRGHIPVNVSLNDVADDGTVGEHDFVHSDVENIFGGDSHDILEGDGVANHLDGAHGNDKLFGGGGDDHLAGRKDDDKLFGEQGNDLLIGGEFEDDLFGGPGDDHLDTRDGYADRAVCGAGTDAATVDAKDQVSASCETVNGVS
jgi:Ca2+-binding RTX toxin-like protein